jgi:hypothetical protein
MFDRQLNTLLTYCPIAEFDCLKLEALNLPSYVNLERRTIQTNHVRTRNHTIVLLIFAIFFGHYVKRNDL